MSFIIDTFFGGAEKKAGRDRARGITEGVEEQRRFAGETREDFAGFRERGEGAGERLQEFLGLRGVEAEQAAISGFQESPGQAFLRERGLRAANRAASVEGGLGGGNILEELVKRGTGFAAQFLGERKDRLSRVAGMGLEATTAGANIGSGISANIANLFAERGDVLGTARTQQASGIRSGLARVAQAFI